MGKNHNIAAVFGVGIAFSELCLKVNTVRVVTLYIGAYVHIRSKKNCNLIGLV